MLVRVFKTIGFFFWLHVLFQKESLVFRTISPRLLVTENEVLIHVGYSKSYKNKQRHEIQSAYLATLGSVYSPRLAISVMLEENDLRVRNDQ